MPKIPELVRGRAGMQIYKLPAQEGTLSLSHALPEKLWNQSWGGLGSACGWFFLNWDLAFTSPPPAGIEFLSYVEINHFGLIRSVVEWGFVIVDSRFKIKMPS